MLKQKLQLLPSGNDMSININLKSEYMLGGLTEDITNLVTGETDESINNTVDGEKMRFMPSTSNSMGVSFYDTTSSSYVQLVAPNEFVASAATSSAFINSFYIYKIYDSVNENVQNLIYTGYLNGTNLNGISSSAYAWNSNYEYGDIHVPNSFIETLNTTSFILYMKLNFYSAKSSKIYPFSKSNPLTTNPLTEGGLYNTLSFNLTTKKYTVTSPFTFFEMINPSYVDNINNSVDSLAIQKPTYPTGNTFTIAGQYITVE